MKLYLHFPCLGRRGSFLGQIPILIDWNQGDLFQKSEIDHTLQLGSREYVYQHAAEFTISCILGYPNDLLRMKKYWANFEQSLLLIHLQPTATHILLVGSFSNFCNSIIRNHFEKNYFLGFEVDLFLRLVKPKGFAWAYFWKLFAKFAKGGPLKSLFL